MMYNMVMDKVCGIVTEYNPFHNGHGHHLAQSRRLTGADCVVAVMSGDFVMRGEPALVDKYVRARMALLGGVDLVLELPVAWATASAEGFADGAIRTLAACGVVDSICFGSELGDAAPLVDIARFLSCETRDFKAELRRGLVAGLSFPAARAGAVCAILGESAGAIIRHPNNILGIEYLKAIIRHDLPIVPYTSMRYGTAHNSPDFDGDSASAGAIRRHLLGGGNPAQLAPLMPQSSYELLIAQYNAGAINCLDNFSQFFHYGLQAAPPSRLKAAANHHYLISDIIKAAKSKDQTHTALQRGVLRIILDISPQKEIPHIRILGFRREKEALLRRIHAAATVPVITNLKNAKHLPQLAQELAATGLWWLGLKPQVPTGKNEFERAMVMV